MHTFGATTTGDADTVARRPAPANLPSPFPSSQTIPIEIVALNLVSVEPIIVTYGGGGSPEPWEVEVGLSPTPSPAGQLALTATTTQGGTFNSQFQVRPLLTFTRISDGAVRTLDLGSFPFQFTATGAPWRAGCLAPALKRPGVNDGFCPGLTTTPPPQKVLTIHQATFASHGVYPAQEALEHFKCYSVEQQPFAPVPVTLSDQFGSRNTTVIRRAELCNPAQKNNEPWINRKAHLQCYAINGPDVNQVRPVHNQFGSQRLLIGKPDRLCATSQKRELPGGDFPTITPAMTIDHFQCYRVSPAGPLLTPNPIPQVTLRDQFGLEPNVVVGPPQRLCTPVHKIHNETPTPIQHPVQHLVCYAIAEPPKRRHYEISNQFEQLPLRTIQPVQLCVPSAKGPGSVPASG